MRHTLPSRCVLRLCLRRLARGALARFWQMGLFVRFGALPATGRTHPRSTPRRHHMASPPHWWPRHTICVQWVVWLCPKRPATRGLEVVVWGLCGVEFCVIGWVVGPPPETNLVCLFPVTGRPPPGILRRATLLASDGWRRWTRIRQQRQNQGYFKGGGAGFMVGLVVGPSWCRTIVQTLVVFGSRHDAHARHIMGDTGYAQFVLF
jgi:hypothetical protein